MNYRCLVCGYNQMPQQPDNYHICPCCGVEYGIDDAFESHEQLRDEWLLIGAPWFSDVAPYIRPVNWDAWNQLDLAGYSYGVPRPADLVETQRVLSAIPNGFQMLNVLRNQPEWKVV